MITAKATPSLTPTLTSVRFILFPLSSVRPEHVTSGGKEPARPCDRPPSADALAASRLVRDGTPARRPHEHSGRRRRRSTGPGETEASPDRRSGRKGILCGERTGAGPPSGAPPEVGSTARPVESPFGLQDRSRQPRGEADERERRRPTGFSAKALFHLFLPSFHRKGSPVTRRTGLF